MSWWKVTSSKSQPVFFNSEERTLKVAPRAIARKALNVGHLKFGNLQQLDKRPADLIPIGRQAYGCEVYMRGFTIAQEGKENA